MGISTEHIERVLSIGWAPIQDAAAEFVKSAASHPDYSVCGLDAAVDVFGLMVSVEVARDGCTVTVAFRLGSVRVSGRRLTLFASARTLPDPLTEEVWAEVEKKVTMLLSCDCSR